jgi:hypothetical protein
MLVLLDRAFDANAFLAEITGTGAMLLARARATRNLPVLEHLPDGSYLSRLDDLPVRMIGLASVGRRMGGESKDCCASQHAWHRDSPSICRDFVEVWLMGDG